VCLLDSLAGHSLGGALAILAAYDLRRLLPAAHITLVTFGAPRVRACAGCRAGLWLV
jgi:predicted lipase